MIIKLSHIDGIKKSYPFLSKDSENSFFIINFLSVSKSLRYIINTKPSSK